jgi:hypothetical protein
MDRALIYPTLATALSKRGDPALVSRTSDCVYILMNGVRPSQSNAREHPHGVGSSWATDYARA